MCCVRVRVCACVHSTWTMPPPQRRVRRKGGRSLCAAASNSSAVPVLLRRRNRIDPSSSRVSSVVRRSQHAASRAQRPSTSHAATAVVLQVERGRLLSPPLASQHHLGPSEHRVADRWMVESRLGAHAHLRLAVRCRRPPPASRRLRLGVSETETRAGRRWSDTVGHSLGESR